MYHLNSLNNIDYNNSVIFYKIFRYATLQLICTRNSRRRKARTAASTLSSTRSFYPTNWQWSVHIRTHQIRKHQPHQRLPPAATTTRTMTTQSLKICHEKILVVTDSGDTSKILSNSCKASTTFDPPPYFFCHLLFSE